MNRGPSEVLPFIVWASAMMLHKLLAVDKPSSLPRRDADRSNRVTEDKRPLRVGEVDEGRQGIAVGKPLRPSVELQALTC